MRRAKELLRKLCQPKSAPGIFPNLLSLDVDCRVKFPTINTLCEHYLGFSGSPALSATGAFLVERSTSKRHMISSGVGSQETLAQSAPKEVNGTVRSMCHLWTSSETRHFPSCKSPLKLGWMIIALPSLNRREAIHAKRFSPIIQTLEPRRQNRWLAISAVSLQGT